MLNLSGVTYHTEDYLYGYANETDFSSGIPVHMHGGWELLYVKSGELIYSVDGNVYEIKPGSLIISRPGEIHSLSAKGVIHYERHSIVITGSLLNKDIIRQIPPDLHVLDISGNNIIPGLFEKMYFYRCNLQVAYLDTVFHALISELWVNIHFGTQTVAPSEVSSSNPIIVRAIDYIKAHLHEPLTVRQVSDALFITSSYLHQCFAKYMDVTPKQYIMLQKLQLVQQALIHAENPTKVCREFGFLNYSTFYRNYQKVYGCRPSDSPRPTLEKIEL